MDALREQGKSVSEATCDVLRLINEAPTAAYTCDGGGLITGFNRRAVLMWGREPKLNDSVDRY